MRGEAMKRVCERIRANGADMSRLAALEFFAREGDWQTAVYAPLVASLEAWKVRREKFYGRKDTGNLPLPELVKFYREFFNGLGLSVKEIFAEPRNGEYLSYIVARISR